MSPDEMNRFNLPVRIPYHKKGALKLKMQIEEGIQNAQKQAIKAKDQLVESFSNFFTSKKKNHNEQPSSPSSPGSPVADESIEVVRADVESPRSSTTSKPGRSLTMHPKLSLFNHHGRLDYSTEPPLLENAYISAITSHVSYWDDIDIGYFLATECFGRPMSNLKGDA